MFTYHRQLESWQAAIRLVEALYLATTRFPRSELYGLTAQIRRSAISVPANIAEGAGSGSRANYTRSLRIARGSLAELETHIVVAARVGYFPQAEADALDLDLQRVGQLLNGQIRALGSPPKQAVRRSEG